MREDLIERLTSKIFENEDFSHVVLGLCRYQVKSKEKTYHDALAKLSKIKPKDCGISPYFTCDETSKLEQVYLELHPEANSGDSGSSSGERSEPHLNGNRQSDSNMQFGDSPLPRTVSATSDNTLMRNTSNLRDTGLFGHNLEATWEEVRSRIRGPNKKAPF